MESRLRRLVGQRGEKSSRPASALDLHTVPYQSASPKAPQPIFIHQPLSKSPREVRKLEAQGLTLKALPYESVIPGKLPIFGNKPQKGNGPVKLQTNRRLSSGELLATSQDYERTLEDIREGDYIVGRKESRVSYSQSPKLGSPHSGTSTPTRGYTIGAGPDSPRVAHNGSKSLWSTTPQPLITRQSTGQSSATIQHSGSDAELSGPSSVTFKPSHAQNEFRSSSSSTPRNSTIPAEKTCGPNPTISALWKAEYGRLIKLYGRDGIDLDIAQLNPHQAPGTTTSSASKPRSKHTSVALEPLPHPGFDRKSFESKRSSAVSGQSSNYRDDTSDASSFNRGSLASSYAASSYAASSSYTTQTSIGDHDTPTTREDIRKIVQEMRSTYLRALEAHAPVPTKPRSTKKKKRVKTSTPQQNNEKPADNGRQTWHGEDRAVDNSDTSTRKTRAASQPVQGFARLSIIEALVPSDSVAPKPELKRADSLTLGGLMGEPRGANRSRLAGESTGHSNEEMMPQISQKKRPSVDSWLELDNFDFDANSRTSEVIAKYRLTMPGHAR